VIPDGSLVLGVNKGRAPPLTAEEIATNTWIAEHYVERRGAMYRKGLKPLG
jgi:hypothetical protein